jgi:hypothetical protein
MGGLLVSKSDTDLYFDNGRPQSRAAITRLRRNTRTELYLANSPKSHNYRRMTPDRRCLKERGAGAEGTTPTPYCSVTWPLNAGRDLIFI